MNEWPENMGDIEQDLAFIERIGLAIKIAVLSVLLGSSIGLAHAAWTETERVSAGWFSDGAVGGYDAAGLSAVGGW